MAKAKQENDRDIRARARRMWREAGSPKGREPEYLERARELQAFVNHPVAGLLHPQPAANEEPIKEASPVRTDQRDLVAAPMTKRKARALRRG